MDDVKYFTDKAQNNLCKKKKKKSDNFFISKLNLGFLHFTKNLIHKNLNLFLWQNAIPTNFQTRFIFLSSKSYLVLNSLKLNCNGRKQIWPAQTKNKKILKFLMLKLDQIQSTLVRSRSSSCSIFSNC